MAILSYWNSQKRAKKGMLKYRFELHVSGSADHSSISKAFAEAREAKETITLATMSSPRRISTASDKVEMMRLKFTSRESAGSSSTDTKGDSHAKSPGSSKSLFGLLNKMTSRKPSKSDGSGSGSSRGKRALPALKGEDNEEDEEDYTMSSRKFSSPLASATASSRFRVHEESHKSDDEN